MINLLGIVCDGLLCFWVIRTIIDSVRTYSRAKRNGIIKVCINPKVIIIFLAVLCFLLIGICIAFGKAADMREIKEQWEQMRGTEYSEYYKDYYNDELAKYSGTEIKDFDRFVEQQIRAYANDEDIFIHTGTTVVVMLLYLLMIIFDRIFYITQNGCIDRLLKEPEELVAECYGGKIKFYFKSVKNREKPIISFKATAENISLFGGFIEKDENNEENKENEEHCFYHGSITSGIKELTPFSTLHGTDRKVVYLTGNIPYALFYIWDKEHNHYEGKHVTAWIKDGKAYYEEQFPDQLKAFYKEVSGYLYLVAPTPDINITENGEGLCYSSTGVPTEREEYIPDVYDELLKYEAAGKLKIRRYNEQSKERQNELIDLIASAIIKENCFNDKAKAEFYQRYFVKAWERAVEKTKM